MIITPVDLIKKSGTVFIFQMRDDKIRTRNKNGVDIFLMNGVNFGFFF